MWEATRHFLVWSHPGLQINGVQFNLGIILTLGILASYF